MVKAIHQENGGHGEGINTGLKNANGKYFKVVDSDDWVNEDALLNILNFIESSTQEPDLYVSNYVYYYGYEKVTGKIRFWNVFDSGKVIPWSKTRKFMLQQNLTLHSCMYKTSMLKEHQVTLPKHIFYEDNYFVYAPMPYVNSLCYLNEDLYCYLIGREGQSVSDDISRKRYMQHLTISKMLFLEHDILPLKKTNWHLYKTMYHHLRLIAMISIVFTRLNNTKESEQAYKDYWAELYQKTPKMARKIKRHSLCSVLTVPGPIGIALVRFFYWASHFVVKFN